MAWILLVFAIACTPLTPEPLPTPSPAPTPTPTPKPTVHGLTYPRAVPLNSPFVLTYCDGPFEFNRSVKVDAYPLGSMGWNDKSRCSQMIVPGLNVKGERILSVDGIGDRVIDVIQHKAESK